MKTSTFVRPSRGVTLTELIIVLAIIAAMLGLLFADLHLEPMHATLSRL